MVQAVDCSDLLSACAVLGSSGGPASRPGPAPAAAPSAPEPLDFLLNFTSLPPPPALAGTARLGCWEFLAGEQRPLRFGLAAFGEPFARDRVISAALVAGRADGQQTVLHAGRLKNWSTYGATCNDSLLQTAGWPARACRELKLAGPPGVQIAAGRRPAPAAAALSDRQVVSVWLRQLQRVRWALLNMLFGYSTWNVGLLRRTVTDLDSLRAALSAQHEVEWLPPLPRLTYLADPFPCAVDGQPSLLVERYSYLAAGRGQIARLALAPGGRVSEPQPAITAAHHLSYPYVVQVGQESYCLPEAAQSGRCRLYRLDQAGRWQPDRTLLDGRAVLDPTLFQHLGLWWLFFTDLKARSTLQLFAYYAEALDGVWRPHPLNPLKCDVTSARPAGRPFRLDGRLYRPAQDCSRVYGGSLTINEVLELTPRSFRERPVLKVRPDPNGPYPDGLHHLVIEDDLIVLDGCRLERDLLFRLRRRRPDRW
jgi:hypothetical protein